MQELGFVQKQLSRDAKLSLRTVERVLAGKPVDFTSVVKVARTLKTRVSDLCDHLDAQMGTERYTTIRLNRIDTFGDLPSGIWKTSDQSALWRPKVRAEYEIPDPSFRQTNLMAKTIELMEELMQPLGAGRRIKVHGLLNAAIKKLRTLEISLYAGRYGFRKGAWPYWDLDGGDEIGRAVVIDYALAVFTPLADERTINKRVDQGCAEKNVLDQIESINEAIAEEARNTIDQTGREFLEQLRKDRDALFINWSTHWGAVEDEG